MVDVVIVLLNWNGWRDTLECLDSICHSNYEDFAIVVVDNDSTDGSSEKIMRWARRRVEQGLMKRLPKTLDQTEVINTTIIQLERRDFVFIQANSNGGFAAGNNLGIRVARGSGARYVWLLNNDTVVDASALKSLVEKADSVERLGICGSVICFYHDRAVMQAVGGVVFNYWSARGQQIGQGLAHSATNLDRLRHLNPTYISGASMLLSVKFLREVGLMEESYFLYFEELDWAHRAGGAWKMATAFQSLVFHKEGASIGTASLGRRSEISQYYLIRNLVRFYLLRRPFLVPIALLRACREMLYCLQGGDRRGFIVTSIAMVHALLGRYGKRP